jgi:hypothetical protein
MEKFMKALESVREKIRKLSAHPVLFAFILLLVAVGAAYVTDKVVKAAGVGQMVQANDEYLNDSLKKSGGSFMILSAIKAGVAVIEGSTVGGEAVATVDIEVGDAVQSIYDFIDMAWKITFFSGATLFLVKVVLQQITALGPMVMMIAFVSGAVVLAIRNWNKNALLLPGLFRRVFWFFLLCTVGIYIALPVTVGAARFLSNKIARPAIAEGEQAFEDLQRETSSESMSDRLFPPGERVADKLDFKRKMNEVGVWCKAMSYRLFDKGIRFCAAFLFDCLIFPGALVLTVWVVIRKGLAGQGVTNRTLREDIEYAFRKIKRDE